MKKICLNCIHFECCDDEGEFLETGYCRPTDMSVQDDDSCGAWVANPQREKDIKNGM